MSIQKRIDNLPVKAEDLVKYILVGNQVLKAQKAKLAAIIVVAQGVAATQAALCDTQDLAEILLYAEARMGELLAKIPKPKFDKQINGSLRGTTETLPAGITKKPSYEAQRLSRNQDVIAQVVAKAREAGEVPVRKHVLNAIAGVHVSRNSGENEWYTPKEYIEAARAVMGSIDVDPASSALANKIVKAKKFYTAEDDGLTKKWMGNVWMNPPYAQPLVTQFCDTFIDKYNIGEIKRGCILINNITETGLGQGLLSICSAVCFPSGRIKFLDINGDAGGAPLQGQMFLYFGKDKRRFVSAFSDFGVCLKR